MVVAGAVSVDFDQLLQSFDRHLKAENKAARTISTYKESVRLLKAFLVARRMPTQVEHVTREHVESFIGDLLARSKPATAGNRYRGVQQWFKWLADEGEIPASPMARMKPPHQPETMAPVLSDDKLRALIKACEGRGFEDRRDAAIIRLLLDTGMRRSECAYLSKSAIDFDAGVAVVLGKGNRNRGCAFGRQAARALDRYLRMRSGHRVANVTDALWLAHKGPMTDSGIAQVVRRRARLAGIGNVHPHLFRHTFAHKWLSGGGQENDLMRLAGWRSRQMIARYAASAADDRARANYQGRAPGDQL